MTDADFVETDYNQCCFFL